MAILKQKKMPSGATAEFHLVHRIEVDTVGRLGYAGIRAYINEAAYLNNDPIVYHWTFDIAEPHLAGASVSLVEATLVTDPESPLFGGVQVPDRHDTLEAVKVRKKFEIRRVLLAIESGGFHESYYRFDSDPTSQSRIMGAVQMAQIATAAGQPFSIDWTLADNTVRTLNAQEMVQVGLALGAHINQCHVTARNLKAQIDAATTKEEVEAINWPTGD